MSTRAFLLSTCLAACVGAFQPGPAGAQSAAAAATPAPAASPGPGTPAPRPFYRDPVWDGAADASLVFNHGRGRWEMFYTNRRATLRLDDPKDVRWVHGTRIGIASTDDGQHWQHLGEAEFPPDCSGGPVADAGPAASIQLEGSGPGTATHWAPELLHTGGTYHLWLTVVPGVHRGWTGPRQLQHLTSTDLRNWHCADTPDLGSQKVIDAAVARLPDGRWRMWFKDEEAGSRLVAADSPDLRQWTRRGPVTEQAAEGPKVFFWQGRWWLVADLWRGLLVLRSDDAERWQTQPERLLAEPGLHPTDRAKGQHPDVVVVGERAFLVYFVHQGGEAEAAQDNRYHQRSVLQVAELRLQGDGWLSVDRNAPPPDLRAVFGSRP